MKSAKRDRTICSRRFSLFCQLMEASALFRFTLKLKDPQVPALVSMRKRFSTSKVTCLLYIKSPNHHNILSRFDFVDLNGKITTAMIPMVRTQNCCHNFYIFSQTVEVKKIGILRIFLFLEQDK